MAKIRLTKNEFKKQKDALKRFNRYLPTLILKKQQLQMEIRKVESQIKEKEEKLKGVTDNLMRWVDVFGEDVGLGEIVQVEALRMETGNIAGIDIPIFQGLDFETREYDLFDLPLWVDTAVDVLKENLRFEAELALLREQIRLIEEELRITTQRVNLFEKVKIPEAKENIRVIQIYLGDQQTAAVVRGKIAKKKIVKVS
ncbi:MAG TPA: V-type ATP synthase subunit D [Spirochaetia bacterium]|nr:V-type ATP synthase subunit D [Spirochaetia bacterium]